MDETLEAFFLLPIPMHPVLLPDLVTGLDRCLQNYLLKAKSGCGMLSKHRVHVFNIYLVNSTIPDIFLCDMQEAEILCFLLCLR